MQVTKVKLSPQAGTKYAFRSTKKSSKKKKISKSKQVKRKRTSRKKSAGRKRSSGRKRSFRKKCSVSTDKLAFINTLKWDITNNVSTATYMGQPISSQDYNKVLCEGRVRLMLPAATATAADQLSVLYEVPIARKQIRIGDILNEIYKFYNMTRLSKVDLKNVSVSEVGKNLMASSRMPMRFRDLNTGNTQFIGLVPQENGLYLVQLGPSGTVSSASLVGSS